MRRILIIIALLVVLVGAGVAAYYALSANTTGVVVAPGGGTTSFPSAGGSTSVTSQTTGTTTPQEPATPTKVAERLVQISPGPVVPGEAVVDVPGQNASSSPDVTIKYLERQSGNVFSYSVALGNVTRTSNRTLPGIESASWLSNGTMAFVRYLSGADFSTINTYALPASGGGGFFLAQNLADVAVSSTSILALASSGNGSSATLSHTDGTHPSLAFTTPLSMLRISFGAKNQYFAFTKPSFSLGGYAFIVDAAGNFSHIAGPLLGLVALMNHSGTTALVSYTGASGMQMELVNTATNEATPLPVATIADKCVWSADDSVIFCGIPVSPPTGVVYPDDWYQGAVHFSDLIWKIDVKGRFAQLVLNIPAETKDSMDVEAPAVDAKSTVLVFVNKNDGSLWSYQL